MLELHRPMGHHTVSGDIQGMMFFIEVNYSFSFFSLCKDALCSCIVLFHFNLVKKLQAQLNKLDNNMYSPKKCSLPLQTNLFFFSSSARNSEKTVMKLRSRLWKQKQGIYSEKGQSPHFQMFLLWIAVNVHRRWWRDEIWSHFIGNWWSLHTCQDTSSNSISTILLGFTLPLVFMLYFKWKFTKGSALRIQDNLFKSYVRKKKHSSCQFSFVKVQPGSERECKAVSARRTYKIIES